MSRVFFTKGDHTANFYLEASDVTWPDVGQCVMEPEDRFDNAFPGTDNDLLTYDMTMYIGSRWDPDSPVAREHERMHNDSNGRTFDPTDYWDTSIIERAKSNQVFISVNFANGYSASISYVIRNKPLPPSTPTDVYAYCSASGHNASDPSVSYYTETNKRVFVHYTVSSDSTSITKNVERSIDGGDWVHIFTSLSTGTNGSHTIQDRGIPLTDGCQVRYRVQASNSIGESGYGYSKTYTFKLNKPPNAPETITVPSSIRGGSNIQLSWPTSTDPEGDDVEYELERQWDGSGSFTQIYRGSSRSYRDTIPAGTHTSVIYRVRAYDSMGNYSDYCTGPVRLIINNAAPSTPGTITIPSTILANKSFQISWGASTDIDDNLTGYKLERSVNSGSTWTQIYQGPSTSYTDTVRDGTPSVTYRVKAYDSYNAESGYRTSNTVGVINNHPPESPASITIPELILGGQPSLIKWEASNDEDHNLVGYELERKLNNTGGFTRIYKGSELQYTDTVEKGTLQVQYRVRAYDSYNAYSEYTTSSLKEVNNNTLPTITGEDTDLGTLESVSYKYTVTDPDEGQTLNVTEYLDDKVHKTLEVTSGVENTLTIDGEEFLQVSKGSHTIVISVDDGQGVLVKRTLTFTRVQTKLSTTLITPLPANEMPTRMYAFIFGNIPAEAIFHFYACNNAFDEEPTWQEVTEEVLMKKKFYFANKTKTADQWGVNVKFEVDRSTVPEGTEIYVSKVTGGFDGYSTQN